VNKRELKQWVKAEQPFLVDNVRGIKYPTWDQIGTGKLSRNMGAQLTDEAPHVRYIVYVGVTPVAWMLQDDSPCVVNEEFDHDIQAWIKSAWGCNVYEEVPDRW
jgi:hypothetical protein